ncbi:MAG: 23S rRNA (guanosine(2251)-2'-O)-methyltransferase RlmB [Bdellovibrionota bacterium]
MSSRLILSGLRSIEECIQTNPDRIAKLLVPPGKLAPRIAQICEYAKKCGVRLETNPRPDPEEPLLAILNEYQYAEFEALVDELRDALAQGQRPVVLALDGVTDPQNLGAILRTAAFMGIPGILLPKDRAAAINNTVYRVASGGLEYLRIARVTNLVSALKELKEIGLWSVGFSEHAPKSLSELKNDFPSILIIGNEEKGIRPLVRENCDFLVSMKGRGDLKSLNASVAAALAMAWATK